MKLPNMYDENEKPLDNLAVNGGFCSIFRTIGCIGDSLSSGEFQTKNADGSWSYTDKYYYSWGQFIGRMTGAKIYNFSRGGLTAKGYLENFVYCNNVFDIEKKCQAYIIALGVNDIYNANMEIGDIKDYKGDKKETFCFYYGKIIESHQYFNPNAKFFLVNFPREKENEGIYNKQQLCKEVSYKIGEFTKEFANCYLIDLYNYGMEINADFRKKFYLNGHLNPLGYKLTADIIASYIDYIIRQNPTDFEMVGLGY